MNSSISPIVVDNFLPDEGLDWLCKLASKKRSNSKFGTMRSTFDNPIIVPESKNNFVSNLSDKDLSKFTRKIRHQLTERGIEKVLSLSKNYQLGQPQLSYYEAGQFYSQHRDRSELGLTMILLVGEKDFKGGELVIYGKKKRSIPFKQNRLIIFSSRDLHEVKKVKGNGTRISLQYFFNSQKSRRASIRDIVANRKNLQKDLVELLTNKKLELQQIIKHRNALKEFVDGTLLGSFRYVYFTLNKELPEDEKISIQFAPDFQVKIENKKLCYTVLIEKKKLWLQIQYGKKSFKAPFIWPTEKIIQLLN